MNPSYPAPNGFCTLQDFVNGQIVLIDKPLEWTSFDVVNKVRGIVRKALGVKKIKVGHAGTLDPLATGLLVVCTGRMTKEIQYLTADAKSYEAEVRLGEFTPSLDRETDVTETAGVDHITEALVQDVAASFEGTYAQIPPVYSAKKVDGKRAYESARKGAEVALSPVEVTLTRCEVLDVSGALVRLAVDCSKGTYIRSLARDFGERLGTVATLDGLRRTASGAYRLEEAWSLEKFQDAVMALEPPSQD